MGDLTWLENWQDGQEGESCGTPIAPHNGSSSATYFYDADASTLKVTGGAAHIGLAKVRNGGEDGNSNDSVTYLVSDLTETSMTLHIDSGIGKYWQFKLVTDDSVAAPTAPPPAITVAQSDAFVDKAHATWVKVINLTLKTEGASSQNHQTLTINITELPAGGANYRIYKTTAANKDYFGPPQALKLGENAIIVASVNFDRAVKIELSSATIKFDALTVNGNQLYPK